MHLKMNILQSYKLKKKVFFWLFYVFLMILVVVVCLEGGTFLLYKFGKVNLIHKNRLTDIINSTPKETYQTKPFDIPHPYFGYIYIPNHRFFQRTWMESNSEGFIDEEFPDKREGLCIFGILGGSAAMSWGVEKREDRISYQLERLLNTHARNDTCKEYRVLNMGIGAQTLYPAVQIYLYYQDLLDGVIFIAGNNEATHIVVLGTGDYPVQFPHMDIVGLLTMVSPLKNEIFTLRQKLSDTATFLLKNPYLLYSYFVRSLYDVYFNNKLQKVERLNEKLKQESRDHVILPGIRPHSREKLQDLRRIMKKYKPHEMGEAYFPADLLEDAMRRVVPLVYTDPLINAFAVSKIRNNYFLNIIQPMLLAMGRNPNWGKPRYRVPMQAKIANKVLNEEAKKMEAFGIKTFNLNEIKIFEEAKQDIFIDGLHLTSEGNKIVARYLFELIQKEWFQLSK